MAITWPVSTDSFTNPAGTQTLASPDHAGQHSDINDLGEAVESVLGTTAGTSVLKNFAAGDFSVRINSSNVLQQALQGTINSSTLGTPTITLGSDAQGDVFYRSSGGTVTRLAPGTSGQFLKTQGAAANPVWASVIIPTVFTTGVVATGTCTSSTVADVGSVTVNVVSTGSGTLVAVLTGRTYKSSNVPENVYAELMVGGTVTQGFNTYHGAINEGIPYALNYSTAIAAGTTVVKLRASTPNGTARLDESVLTVTLYS